VCICQRRKQCHSIRRSFRRPGPFQITN
jgi:hypothetical protein